MPTDLLTLHLPQLYPAGQLPGGLDFRGLDVGMADELAQCYLMSYPPDVAASDLGRVSLIGGEARGRLVG